MSYATIDPVINAWATRHKFTLYTKFKDSEVRAVDVVSSEGKKFQIWIDRPNGENVGIHAWDYKKRRQDWQVNVLHLDRALEEATQTVRAWL